MIIVLSLITLLSGLVLGGLNELTAEKAENNELKFKKIPAVAGIYEAVAGKLSPENRTEVEEALLAEKKELKIGKGEPVLMFVIKKDNKPYAVAIENSGKGYGGDLGVMIGYQLETGNLVGLGITTMSETPGVGTRVKETSFTKQFQGMSRNANFSITKDGGDIDAVTGATISSRAVAQAVSLAKVFYDKHEEKIRNAVTQ